MNTEEARQQIKPYLIGDLTPKETAVLEGHIDVDEAAQWYHQRYYRQLLPVLKQPAAEPSEGVMEALFAKARREIASGTNVQRSGLKVLASELKAVWKYAAILVVGVLGIWGFMSSGSRPAPGLGTLEVVAHATGTSEINRLPSGVMAVPANHSGVLNLSDGTRLQVTPGSKLRVDLESSEGNSSADYWLVSLERGEVLVQTSPHGNRVIVEVADDADHRYAYESAGISDMGSFSVSVHRPSNVVRPVGSALYLDQQMQPIGEVLKISESFRNRGNPVGAITLAENLSEDQQLRVATYRVSLPAGEYDFAAFVDGLRQAGLKIESANGQLVCKGFEQASEAMRAEFRVEVAGIAGGVRDLLSDAPSAAGEGFVVTYSKNASHAGLSVSHTSDQAVTYAMNTFNPPSVPAAVVAGNPVLIEKFMDTTRKEDWVMVEVPAFRVDGGQMTLTHNDVTVVLKPGMPFEFDKADTGATFVRAHGDRALVRDDLGNWRIVSYSTPSN